MKPPHSSNELHFEWDLNKSRSNILKHGIAFEEATTIFGDPRSITIEDSKHSKIERRYVTIGVSFRVRTLVVIHTERGNNIRIISARLASRNERRTYEENT